MLGWVIFAIYSFDLERSLSGQMPLILTSGALLVSYLLSLLLVFRKKSYSSFRGHYVKEIINRKIKLKVVKVTIKTIFFLSSAMVLGVILLISNMFYEEATFDFDKEPEEAKKYHHYFAKYKTDYAGAIEIAVYILIIFYTILFFLPSLLCFPAAFLVAIKWRNPAKFMLLRAFNDRVLAKPLKRLIRNEIGYIGHTYTLADIEIKTPWYVKLPILIGQLGYLNFRFRVVKKQEHVDRMIKVVQNRWLRNLNWSMSRNNIFPIRTIDEFWKECVINLLPSMDAIFVDLSEIRSNLLWEAQQCTQLGVGEKIIFLVREDAKEEILNFISQFSSDNDFKKKVLKYTISGKVNKNDFKSMISSLLST
jgi:hypothetical protein